MLADLDDADNLQAFRLQLGLTQEELAELLALVAWERFRERAAPNANMVSKWERGMKAPGKLYRRCFRLLRIAIPDELDAYLTRLGCDTVEAMNRRQALGVAAALGAAVALPEQLFNSAAQEPAESSEVAGLRDVLLRYETTSPRYRAASQLGDLERLHRDIDAAWGAFQGSHYAQLSSMLPGLIASCQAAAGECDGEQQQPALRLLSQAYQLTAFDLTKHGEGQLALLAADRGMLAAQQAADALAAAGCARVLAAALLSAGQDRKAKELCLNLATPLQRQLGVASPTHLSVYGSLLLKASIATSRLGERADTQELLAEAERAAQRLGRDANCMWTAFGPTNVRVHRVATSVELGDGGTAVEHAKQIRPTRLPSLERRAQCLVDIARGYGQWGRTSEATKVLLAAEQVAPEEVRVQPKVRSLVLELLHQRRRRDPELRRLAHRVGALS
jgi:transcriptional regulator with XRE-family HTH domain